MRKFTALAAGLLASVLGSAFTAFALGVWVFQHTQSATQYGVTILLNFLPGILVAPLAGAFVDRWNRRVILMVSDALNAVTILGLAGLYAIGALEPWHVFIAIGIQSLLRALQVPAMNSVVVLLAPKDQVGRANGLVMLAQSIGGTVGFAVGGVLLVAIGLDNLLLIDCATFVLNLLILLFVAIPQPERSAAGSEDAGRLLGEIQQGWRYLAAQRGLVALVVFHTALCIYVGYADVLLTPIVLSFANATALGIVLAFAGVGMILGSVALTAWGGPRQRIHALAGFALPLGLFLCLGALRPNVPLIVIAVVGFTFCSTIIEGTSRNVLQLVVEPDMQGRAFATFNMVAQGVQCVSYALAGPVADRYFEPLLRDDGPLAGTVGALIGVGKGRGMAFLLLLLGLLMLVTALIAYLQPSLRGLPDRPSHAEAQETEAEKAKAQKAGAEEAEPAGGPTPAVAAEAVTTSVPDRH